MKTLGPIGPRAVGERVKLLLAYTVVLSAVNVTGFPAVGWLVSPTVPQKGPAI